MIEAGNLFANLAERAMREEVAVLAETAGGRIERIVSTGQASRPDFGTIRPRRSGWSFFPGAQAYASKPSPSPRVLAPGDWLEIPAHARHRVEWTDAERPTVWLAVHLTA